ncbi:AraC family transcriptional regulator [Mycobacterium sp. TJFP1]
MGLPHSSRTMQVAPWGMWFLPSDGAGFHVVLKGSCWLIPAAGKPIKLSPGDIAFLPTGRGHGLCDDPDTPLVDVPPTALVEFGTAGCAQDGQASAFADRGGATVMLCGAYRVNRGHLHPLLAELPEVVHLPASVGLHPSLRATVDLLGSELEARRPGSDAIITALLDALLLYIVRAWLDRSPGAESTDGWTAALRDSAVHAALHCIHDEPAQAWTVGSLAARVGVSRAAFARRFSALTGQAPMAYVTWWRMVVASRQLVRTDKALRVVATEVGYTSEFAFAKAFKRHFGVSPGSYRRQQAIHGDRPHTTLALSPM